MGEIYTVTQVNLYIKKWFESNTYLRDIWIKGEISNYKAHYSGHMYFTLKDETGLMKGVMFRGRASTLRFMPENGMKVIVRGRISVYERDGVYQIYAEEMQPDGLGNLHLAFEQLKAKLEKEGLFAPQHKKKLPFYPEVVGVITSSTGAVWKDILHVAKRRNPGIAIKLFPVAVQGMAAAPEIVHAIKRMNEERLCDVMIVGRGGGSLEDLWGFNEESVARAIFQSEIPVVSAVGHETDFTIADFVADLRAPTPSAAAELVIPDKKSLMEKMAGYDTRLKNALQNGIQRKRAECERLQNAWVLKQPLERFHNERIRIDNYAARLAQKMGMETERKKRELSVFAAKLQTLSPLTVIGRGFAVAYAKDGETVVKTIGQVEPEDAISVRVSDGFIQCNVVGTKKVKNV